MDYKKRIIEMLKQLSEKQLEMVFYTVKRMLER